MLANQPVARKRRNRRRTLRRSFARRLLEAKFDIRVIPVLPGRKPLKPTALYTQVATDLLHELISPLEAARHVLCPRPGGSFVLLIQDVIGCHPEGGCKLGGHATLRRLHGPLHLNGRLRSGAPRTRARPAPWP